MLASLSVDSIHIVTLYRILYARFSFVREFLYRGLISFHNVENDDIFRLHGHNLSHLFQVCKRTGAVLEVIPSDETGEIDLKALESMLTAGGVKAVAITHVPTNGGVVNPAQEGRATTSFTPYAASIADML